MHTTIRSLPVILVATVALTVSAVGAAAATRSDQLTQAEAARLAHLAEHGESHATGNRPELGPHQRGNPDEAVQELRIGLRYSWTPDGDFSEFFSFEHPAVAVTATEAAFDVVDQATGAVLISPDADEVVEVHHDGDGYVVTDPAGDDLVAVDGPIRFRSDHETAFAVPSIERVDIDGWIDRLTPEYRGELQVDRGDATPEGTVNLVNHVELEDYVPGVVINESPAFFHPQALRSQATTARGYAVANIGRFIDQGQPFDLDDSALSQVYRGRTAEHPNGNAAAEATRGLVVSHEGEIISAFYSSSMAGHPEDVEWSFDSLGDPAEALPYLIGRYDGRAGTAPDLATEEGRRAFWEGDAPDVHDSEAISENPRNRWRYTYTRAEAETAIDAQSALAEVISGSDTTIGTLGACDPTLHSPTGRIVVVRCTGSDAVWEFSDWDTVRQLLPSPELGVLNNPAFLDHTHDADGQLESITVIGGGWGHNVGMSQYGAHGRGLEGQDFTEILTFYYADTTVGSYPLDLEFAAGPPVAHTQSFATADGTGTLQVRDATHGVRVLHVDVNGERALTLTPRDLGQPLLEVDITEHLEPGVNSITYTPRGPGGTATALVTIAE